MGDHHVLPDEKSWPWGTRVLIFTHFTTQIHSTLYKRSLFWNFDTLSFKWLKYANGDRNLKYPWQNVRQSFSSSTKAKYVTKNTSATVWCHRLGFWLQSLTEFDYWVVWGLVRPVQLIEWRIFLVLVYWHNVVKTPLIKGLSWGAHKWLHWLELNRPPNTKILVEQEV